MKKLVIEKTLSSNYISAQKKYYKIIKNERPKKILSIHDFRPGETEASSKAEFLIALQVQEGLFKKRQHIYKVYQDKSTIFYYDYAENEK